MSNHKERFNKMYELGYDLSWLDKEIPQEIRDYLRQLISERSLDVEISRVMDLGCGRGLLLRYLAQVGFKHVVGVDASNVAAELAKQNADQSSVMVADVIKGLPFQAGAFSLITELTVLSSSNPQYWSVMLDEISRCLESGGFYISEIFSRDQSCDLYQPLVTRSAIPRELDQVYGVTRNELVSIFGRRFSIKDYQPINPVPSKSFFVLAQKL